MNSERLIPYHGVRPEELRPEVGPLRWWQWLVAIVLGLLLLAALVVFLVVAVVVVGLWSVWEFLRALCKKS